MIDSLAVLATSLLYRLDFWSQLLARVASGTLKCLAIVSDATHEEEVVVIAERTISGDHLTRILDFSCCDAASRICSARKQTGFESYDGT